MKFDEYSYHVLSLAVYPRRGANLIYPALKLAGEAGEAADKIGKKWRNHDMMSWADLKKVIDNPEEWRTSVIKELGDVLWYVAALAEEMDSSLEEVALENIKKLNDRHARGTIKGEGDNR